MENSEEKEKTFTFYKTIVNDYTGVETIPYTLKESELERSHQALLYTELVQQWNKSSKDSQLKFIHEFLLELKDARRGE